MTDKELVELAAKAAGIDGEWNENFGKSGMFMLRNPTTYRLGFDPLTDDGDALRLAVKLGVSDRVPLRICIEYQDDGEPDFTCVEHFGENTVYHTGDPARATRLAIVMAAAQIGKEME